MKVKATGDAHEFSLEYGDRVVYGELDRMRENDAELWHARGLYGFDFNSSQQFDSPAVDEVSFREVVQRFVTELAVPNADIEIAWDRKPDELHRQAWIDLTNAHDGTIQDI